MKFNFTDSLVPQEEVKKAIGQLSSYLEHLKNVSQNKDYEENESSINLPADKSIVAEVLKLRDTKAGKNLKYIIDIGIGGSNLGTKAVYDALLGFADILQPDRFPKIIFADTNDPEFLECLLKLLDTIDSQDEILINVISKSGTTTETIANLDLILSSLKSKFPEIYQRVVATTDFQSKLWQKVQELGISTLTIPKMVGGRYSVLSPVGLFPLACAGVEVELLKEGALKMRDLCLEPQIDQNPALLSAIFLYYHSKQGKNISDNFFFHTELESVGKWYRQLMGESIGKEKDLEGEKVNVGITPTVSLGSVDLHSMAQLYLGGPNDKTTTFVSTQSINNEPQVSSQGEFVSLVEGIAGKNASTVMQAILEGTKEAYRQKYRPFGEVVLEDLSAYSLGEFLQFKMIEMMFLGKLFNVNTFDQPNVEDYKVHARNILSNLGNNS